MQPCHTLGIGVTATADNAVGGPFQIGYDDIVMLFLRHPKPIELVAFLSMYPHCVFFPALFIALLLICMNLFGNGLRDALNPTVSEGE